MKKTIQRTHFPSNSDFIEYSLNLSRPVLIDEFVSSWPALDKWTPEYLADRWGERVVPIVTLCDGDYAHGKLTSMQLGEYLRIIGAIEGQSAGILNPDTTNQTELKYYLAQVSLSKYFPELLENIVLPSFFQNETAGATVIYVGGTLFSQLHYHPFGSATLSVLSGKKRVRLFAPDQGPYLYPHSWWSNKAHLSKTHHKNPDPMEFPKFAKAEFTEVTVSPGEMLFIPIYWWHSIENIGVSISVTSFWTRDWKSRFLPPVGPRGPYLYEPASKFARIGKAALSKVGRAMR